MSPSFIILLITSTDIGYHPNYLYTYFNILFMFHESTSLIILILLYFYISLNYYVYPH